MLSFPSAISLSHIEDDSEYEGLALALCGFIPNEIGLRFSIEKDNPETNILSHVGRK
jgi:hypothetical protein